ncbi:MAG: F0F1 ATP synthase subunit epsilon [Thermoleophilia bacterium]|nr:F0F1 ATP synthase subunit epsilon [Thermoleophilia bacterium]
MRLKVMAPAKVVIDLEVDKVVARSPDGYFCLLPHHVDFVSGLAPGILTYEDEGGRKNSLAIDEGVLAKCCDEVLVATRNAIGGGGGREPQRGQVDRILDIGEDEKKCREVIAKLEAECTRQLLNEEDNG